MRAGTSLAVGFLACAVGGLALMNAATGSPQGPSGGTPPPYMDPSLPIARRVDDLVSRMTLEEKASQFQHASPAIARLGVPAYNWWSEGLHGVASNTATVFPQAIGLAATWDAPLLHDVATAISTEARGIHHQTLREGHPRQFAGLTFWSPNINIFRDPRWGRGQETYGEDPYLTARMGVSFVTGMQGDDPKYMRVVATPKHFAVHSGPEPTRHRANVDVSKHDMMDTYLPAFRATVVEGKAESVMGAYNSINGQPACANNFLLKDMLRGAWGFDGYVVSDCGAITDIYQGHHFVMTHEEAAAVSLKAGTDLACTFSNDTKVYLNAITTGLVSEADADTALKRLFHARFALGQFDPPEKVKYAQIPFSVVNSEPNRLLALRAARESMVLLKNDGVLPLSKGVGRIAVVGPLAESVTVLLGNYNGTPVHPVTVLDGLRRQFPKANVTYTPGTKFLHNPVAIPADAFTTDTGKPGLSAAYFANKDLSGTPAVSRDDKKLGIGAGAGTLPDALTGKDWAGRWTGKLTAPDTGTYKLAIRGGGGARLWLDGKPILDDWQERAGGPPRAGNDRTVEVSLEKGKKYDLKFEYFRTALPGGAPAFAQFRNGFQVMWMKAGGEDTASAVAAAKDADIVVAVVGITSELEGEEMNGRQLPEGFKGGDRTSLDLPKDEQAILEAVQATGKPLIVVLTSGSALGVNWAQQHANAILQAWYPGEEGGTAVAETLVGENNPAGRLPVTFYRSVDDLPPFEDYSMKARTYRYYTGPVLYPFGYGLSYSKFLYSDLKLSAPRLAAGKALDVDVDVKNTSKRAGDEVVQLYLSFPGRPGAPIQALRGFRRVSVPAGATRHVHFTLDARDLSWVNEAGDRLVSAGVCHVHVGGGLPAVGPSGIGTDLTIDGEYKLPD